MNPLPPGETPRPKPALTPTQAIAVLARAGLEAPEREVRLLLAHALGIPADRLIEHPRDIPPCFAALVERRARREPLALIVGKREFWSLEFSVSRATLVPRPESETLIESALAAFPDPKSVQRILDLGTGTGCLLLGLLSEYPNAFGIGLDRVAPAADLAAANARRLGFAARAAFFVGDWSDALAGRFDLVLANPPYVARATMAALMPEVARFEPATALDGGPDGLDAYGRLVPQLPDLLAPGGLAILEVGAGAADSVLAIACRAGLEVREFRPDLSGIPRALALAALTGAGKNRLASADETASLRSRPGPPLRGGIRSLRSG